MAPTALHSSRAMRASGVEMLATARVRSLLMYTSSVSMSATGPSRRLRRATHRANQNIASETLTRGFNAKSG